uniref:MyTH4 domain-containing protein n=1 Tax=Oryctolagus cuniculus TaxID=9986 RepID=A0A5F9CS82_RABIT
QELGRLEIPAELAATLRTAKGHLAGLAGSITECLPPEVPARPRLALPPDIDQFPFSSFIATSFQEPSLPSPGQPLARPLTRLDAENSEPALDINRVMLRLLGDGSLPPWQEQAMGLYLVRQGQRCPGLRDELFSQLVAQLWHNPDEQQSQRGWALMAVLLSAFPPTPALQKPLLKFVSDQAPQGMAALCQHKLLGALEQTPLAPGAARAHPPTQLEWTAGWRRGRMALDVFTFSLEAPPRGWSVSLHSGDTWQDLAGCDIVLDLIGQTEDLGDPAQPQGYPITPLGLAEDIPPAPGVQAPTLPPGLPPGPAPTLPGTGHAGEADLGTLGLDLEQGWALSGRMKGGGGIGTPQQAYPFVYPGVVQMPGYQPAMIPAPLSMMPAMGTVPTMPGMTGLGAPAPFSGGRALPGAQQMTTQAMSLSLEQQAQQRQRQAQASRDAAQDPPPAVTPKPKKPPTPRVEPKRDPEPMGASLRDEDSEDSPDGPLYPKSFQQKRDYFQKMGQEQIRVKTMKPPAKIRIPQQEEEEEEGEEEKGEDVGAVPAPPPPPGGKEPLQRGRDKAANEAEPEPEEKAGPKAGPAQGRRPTVRNLNGTSQRPEPSREIRNIIRMYQSRPGPVPVPVQPSRTPKAFWKKNDPKDEALAKLGINGTHSPPSTLSPSLGKAPPPAVAPRPKDAPRPGPSSSIREKQEPLRDLFSHTLPAAQALPPPPAPPLPPPVDPGTPAAEPHGEDPGPMRDQGFSTRLLVPSGSVCFSYASAPWRLFLRKEVFYPREAFSHPYGLKLLCEQILRDTFAESCTRISQEERSKMKDLLGHLEVGLDSLSTAEDSVRKRIVVAARDNWANYFSRIFPVSGGNGSDVQLLGVSHRGLRLLKVTQAHPHPVRSFAEVLGVECRGGSSLELSLKSEQLVLRSARAKAIKAMVELFLSELKKASLAHGGTLAYVVALRTSTAGDLIKLLPVATLEPGYPRGAAGRSGLFPADLVQPAAAPDFSFSEQGSSRWRKSQLPLGEPGLAQWSRVSERPAHRRSQAFSDDSEATSLPSSVAYSSLSADPHNYTMQEFALRYFRKPQLPCLGHMQVAGQALGGDSSGWARPAGSSLRLVLPAALMQFMGDQSKRRGKDAVNLLYELLKLSGEENLRDEIYCQAIKQVTGHPRPERCARGWSFLSLLTGFFPPSTTLMPYVTKFLQDSGPGQELARSSQKNLQRTVKYGGRRRLPPPSEMKAFLVAAEVLEELCGQMGISDPQELQEFALFLIKGEGELVRPLWPHEYLNSVLVHQKVSLHSRRLGWETPLHFDNSTYISTHFSQVLRDYLQGKLMVSAQADAQLARLAAFQHLGKADKNPPSEQELLTYIPKLLHWQVDVAAVRSLMGQELQKLQGHSSQEAQISFISGSGARRVPGTQQIPALSSLSPEATSQLPLFGHTVYVVQRVSNLALPGPALLGLNRQHLLLLDPGSQKTCGSIDLKDLQQLHLLSPLEPGGPPGLEINYGSADSPQSMWLELPQAQELLYTIVFLLDSSLPVAQWPGLH